MISPINMIILLAFIILVHSDPIQFPSNPVNPLDDDKIDANHQDPNGMGTSAFDITQTGNVVLSKNFKLKEFQDKNDNILRVAPELVQCLQKTRDYLNDGKIAGQEDKISIIKAYVSNQGNQGPHPAKGNQGNPNYHASGTAADITLSKEVNLKTGAGETKWFEFLEAIICKCQPIFKNAQNDIELGLGQIFEKDENGKQKIINYIHVAMMKTIPPKGFKGWMEPGVKLGNIKDFNQFIEDVIRLCKHKGSAYCDPILDWIIINDPVQIASATQITKMQDVIADDLYDQNGNSNIRVAYVESGKAVISFDHMCHEELSCGQLISDREILLSNESKLRESIEVALDLFESADSDNLRNDKKIVIFSYVESDSDVICENFEDAMRQKYIDVIMVNTQSITNADQYIMCLTGYDENKVIQTYDDDAPYDISSDILDEVCEEPSPAPTIDPTTYPTADPTRSPTTDPTRSPSTDPTRSPSTDPTRSPTTDPTREPTDCDCEYCYGLLSENERLKQSVCESIDIQSGNIGVAIKHNGNINDVKFGAIYSYLPWIIMIVIVSVNVSVCLFCMQRNKQYNNFVATKNQIYDETDLDR